MQSSEYNLFSNINTNGVTVADTFNSWRKSTNGIIQKLTVEAGSPTWDASGKVVIGGVVADNGSAIVDVGVASTGTRGAILNLGSSSNVNSVVINRASGTNGTFTVTNNGTGLFSLSQAGAGDMRLLTSGLERVRILANGRVGIGTTAPDNDSLLHVNGGNFKVSGTINSAAITSSSTIGGTNITASGYLYANTLGIGTSNTAFTVSQAGAIVGTALNAGSGPVQTTGAITGGTITGTSLVSSGGLAAGGAITGVTTINATGSISAGSFFGALTGNVNGNLNGTASAVADNSVSPSKLQSSASYTIAGLSCNGTVSCGAITSNGTMNITGAIIASGDITAFSDIRLKKDVETISGALSMVNQLRGVRFTFTNNDKNSIGVIAQELQEVAPELVETSGEYLSVAYGNISGILIEAIKELSAKVERLENVTPN